LNFDSFCYRCSSSIQIFTVLIVSYSTYCCNAVIDFNSWYLYLMFLATVLDLIMCVLCIHVCSQLHIIFILYQDFLQSTCMYINIMFGMKACVARYGRHCSLTLTGIWVHV